MRIKVDALGRGATIQDGQSPLRVTLTSVGPVDRRHLSALASLLLGQGTDIDAVVIAEWIGLTATEVEYANDPAMKERIALGRASEREVCCG